MATLTKKSSTRQKQAQVELYAYLLCPECDQILDGQFSVQGWNEIPTLLKCGNCGAESQRPRSPFKGK